MDAGLAIGIAALIVTAIIAGASFYFTYATSTAALQKSLQLSSKMKIAEFRMKWIDEFRMDLAHLMKLRLERILIAQRERRRDLDIEATMLRGRLLLRLKPNSDYAEERELEQIFKRATERDPDKANVERKRTLELSRILLKREWEKAKAEINQ